MSDSDGHQAGPVAIGGLGGSGTRVFAALLRAAGFRIGPELNDALDNLWFSALFKRRDFVRAAPPEAELDRAVRLFRDAMTVGLAGRLSPGDAALLDAIAAALPPAGRWAVGAEGPAVASLRASRGGTGPWGWKEPNAHHFLPALDARLPGLRYVHVVRDARDMALSRSTWQLGHWGPRPPEDAPLPVRQLRWWTRANARALDHGAGMGARFLVIEYEDFCARPRAHWDRLLGFLAPEGRGAFPEDLVRPSTIGRGAALDPGLFPRADLEAAEAVAARVARLGRA